jgi:hypothetical protein
VPARSYAWRRTDEGVGHSFARVASEAGKGWRFDGTEILIVRGRALLTRFSVLLDAEWMTREVEVEALSRRRAALRLDADDGHRWRINGRRAARLDGCIDVDVAATPLTNTFPIRRYADLAVGASRTSPVAWVEVPSLRVLRVNQTYRRLGKDAWEYSDPGHGAFRITLDADGIVVDYEGFATRVV